MYYDVIAETMTLWFLVCINPKCMRLSALVEDYHPGKEHRGEWEAFWREHGGPEHDVRVGRAVGD